MGHIFMVSWHTMGSMNAVSPLLCYSNSHLFTMHNTLLSAAHSAENQGDAGGSQAPEPEMAPKGQRMRSLRIIPDQKKTQEEEIEAMVINDCREKY